MTTPIKREFSAWAVDTRSTEGHGYIGRYWWFNGAPPKVLPQLEGCKVCLFKTRREAREAAHSVRRQRGGWDRSNSWRPTAVKVRITIEQQ